MDRRLSHLHGHSALSARRPFIVVFASRAGPRRLRPGPHPKPHRRIFRRRSARHGRRSDPLGFSLESFDPVGSWRATYPKGKQQNVPPPKIDASGEFTSGETYQDFAGFKKIIRETRADLFVRHLIGEILSYSAGRLMEPADDFVIGDILEKAKKENLGLRTLLVECLPSPVFRSR